RRKRAHKNAVSPLFLSDDSAGLGKEIIPHVVGADVLNLHWTVGFVDLGRFLHSLPARIPVVITMHDMLPFTGGCHYTNGCTGFAQECGTCPILGSNRENDLSRQIWRRKRNAYRSREASKTAFVADSNWL